MLKYEFQKLLHYRHGLWLVLVLLVVEIAGIFLTTEPYDKELEANRAVYDEYLSPAEGPLTEEKRSAIEDEMLRLSKNHTALERLKSGYYNGTVSESEFREQYDLLLAEDERYSGFSKLYTQYIFVRESEQRQFLYTGGWELLLGIKSPDYVFLTLLVFLLAPVFCQEYSSQMDQILLTQKKSVLQQWSTKLIVALSLTAFLTVFVQLFRLAYLALRFGLPHWDYNLCSLISFGNITKQLTLGQAFGLQSLLQLLGYGYCALIILTLSVLTRKYAITLMSGLVLLPLPVLALRPGLFVRLPGPWALTIGSCYLRGDSAEAFSSRVYAVEEVSWNELVLLVSIGLALMALMILLVRLKNRNYLVRHRRIKAVAALLLLPLLLMSGCSKEPAAPVCFNMSSSNHFENDRFAVFTLDFDKLYLLDKQTDRVSPFPLDAFVQNMRQWNTSLFSRDNKLYYMRTDLWYSRFGMERNHSRTAVMAVDLDTMEETPVYQWPLNADWFFGLFPHGYTENQLSSSSPFFLHGSNFIYQINSDIYSMSLISGEVTHLLNQKNAANVAYDGTNLYYLDKYNRMTLRNLDSGQERTFDDVVASQFLLTPEGVYFLNIRDGKTLYYWNEATGQIEKRGDLPAYTIYWDSRYCWLSASDGLYRMGHDGSEVTFVDVPGFVTCLTQGSVLLFSDHETDAIYRVDKDTLSFSVFQTE